MHKTKRLNPRWEKLHPAEASNPELEPVFSDTHYVVFLPLLS